MVLRNIEAIVRYVLTIITKSFPLIILSKLTARQIAEKYDKIFWGKIYYLQLTFVSFNKCCAAKYFILY